MLGPPSASAQYAARRSTCWGWKPWLNAWPTTSSAITRRCQASARRPFHPPPRRQFACLHNDNRPVSLQDNGRGGFSRGYNPLSDGTRLSMAPPLSQSVELLVRDRPLVDDGQPSVKPFREELPTIGPRRRVRRNCFVRTMREFFIWVRACPANPNSPLPRRVLQSR